MANESATNSLSFYEELLNTDLLGQIYIDYETKMRQINDKYLSLQNWKYENDKDEKERFGYMSRYAISEKRKALQNQVRLHFNF